MLTAWLQVQVAEAPVIKLFAEVLYANLKNEPEVKSLLPITVVKTLWCTTPIPYGVSQIKTRHTGLYLVTKALV